MPIHAIVARLLLALIVLQALTTVSRGEPDRSLFDAFFLDETLRIDFHHGGHAEKEDVSLDHLYRQGPWAGSRVHLLDPFAVGRYVAEVKDAGSGKLLFTKRFDSYFGEYRTTTAASDKVARVYHESILAPFPKEKVRLSIKVRTKERNHKILLDVEIDPKAYTIRRDATVEGVKTYDLHHGGDSHAAVDVAIVAEGYTAAEEPKLKTDLDRFAKAFLSQEPFASAKGKFNLRGVWKASRDSGCDEPSRGVWRDTAIGTSFDSLGSERYLLTEENRALRDIASNVPYDALYIMVNSPRYGGGGIYNLYCTFTSDNQWQEYVFVHEFGHTFAGLADEYYTSSVAYNDFYPQGVEPDEPNITALLDLSKIKWTDLVTPGTPVPTPWEKAGFDEKDIAYQKVRELVNSAIAAAMRSGAPEAEVEKLKENSERLSREHAEKMNSLLAKSQQLGQVGAFEGAGYAAKGLYRSSLDCIMFGKGTKPFCPVCRQAIEKVIAFYGE